MKAREYCKSWHTLGLHFLHLEKALPQELPACKGVWLQLPPSACPLLLLAGVVSPHEHFLGALAARDNSLPQELCLCHTVGHSNSWLWGAQMGFNTRLGLSGVQSPAARPRPRISDCTPQTNTQSPSQGCFGKCEGTAGLE